MNPGNWKSFDEFYVEYELVSSKNNFRLAY